MIQKSSQQLHIRKQLFECAIFFIMLFNTLRTFMVTNQIFLIVLSIPTVSFMVLSATSLVNFKLNKLQNIRLVLCIFSVFLLLSFILVSAVQLRKNDAYNADIHDGVVITEEAYSALLNGRNPYAISFDNAFKKGKNYLNNLEHNEENHYTYSPLMFLINTPIFYATQSLFNTVDMRITSLIFFLASALIAIYIIKEKILFTVFFLLNPIFLYSLFYGANEIFVLFFLIICIVGVSHKKYSLSTIILAFATGTKLLITPLLPLYFIFLYFHLGKNKDKLFQQILIYCVVSLLIYLPFFIWSPSDLIDDIVLFHIGGSNVRLVAGYIGLPQLFLKFGIIHKHSSFPFILLSLPVLALTLLLYYKSLKKDVYLNKLLPWFVILFIILLSFSRIIQTDYLTFISQVLLVASFM